MCGIVGAVAERDVARILLEGLKRLEYRGYDSAGIAVLNAKHQVERLRTQGKVASLWSLLEQKAIPGHIGVAHTRWATHGIPSEDNAHPHLSHQQIAVVHNGIIENFESLRSWLKDKGYQFTSATDSEVVAHLYHYHYEQKHDAMKAAFAMAESLHGAFALGILNSAEPNRIIAIRSGSPLVVGVGIGEHFISSDSLALLPVTQRFIYLEEGDIADVTRERVDIYHEGVRVERSVRESQLTHYDADRGVYRHFMEKEIFMQPDAVSATLEGRLSNERVFVESFGENAAGIFDRIERVQIVACGTSYHAGMVARYWLESLAAIPCKIEIASEFRYRKSVVEPNTLFVTISQSGETADTLAALRAAKNLGFAASLAICNVPESSLVRESDLIFMTRAGIEVGVASTKAFTTQLVSLLMLTLVLAEKRRGPAAELKALVSDLKNLPNLIHQALELSEPIEQLAQQFSDKSHALFLGRGIHYPIAMEGALKLKEISYIHAEAYPAGELKHGPLALVDSDMPVVVVAPNDELLEKLKSNLQEVRARGGELYVFADNHAQLKNGAGTTILAMPTVNSVLAPIIYTIPLQLLAYYAALQKGTDVDQPRNLAKSVTVE